MARLPMIIGVAGGTASGKSWLAQAMVRSLDPDCVSVAHDRFYKSAEPGAPLPNFDHPDALDNNALVACLRALREGRPTYVPRYDFSCHRRLPEDQCDRIDPRPVILVEGILVLAVAEVRRHLDLTVFVHAPADLRLARRLRRDVVQRGRTMADVLAQYENTVRPMHDAFVEPSRDHANIVLDGTRPLAELLEVLQHPLRRVHDAAHVARSLQLRPEPDR